MEDLLPGAIVALALLFAPADPAQPRASSGCDSGAFDRSGVRGASPSLEWARQLRGVELGVDQTLDERITDLAGSDELFDFLEFLEAQGTNLRPTPEQIDAAFASSPLEWIARASAKDQRRLLPVVTEVQRIGQIIKFVHTAGGPPQEHDVEQNKPTVNDLEDVIWSTRYPVQLRDRVRAVAEVIVLAVAWTSVEEPDRDRVASALLGRLTSVADSFETFAALVFPGGRERFNSVTEDQIAQLETELMATTARLEIMPVFFKHLRTRDTAHT